MNTYKLIKSGFSALGTLYDVIDEDNVTHAIALSYGAAWNLMTSLNSDAEGQL